MTTAATVLAILGMALSWYFVFAFWLLTGGDWRFDQGGRHVMHLTANLAVLMSLAVLGRVWPGYPGRPGVVIAAFGLLVAQLGWQVVFMHKVQAERRSRKREDSRA